MTVHNLLLLLAAALFTALAAPCAASSTRGEVLLDREIIQLGDVFELSGAAALAEIGPAPEPGRKLVYDVSALAQMARAHRIGWKPKSNYERVTVTRASQTLSNAVIREKIISELSTVTSDKDLDVALDNQGLEIHRPTRIVLDVRVADLGYDPVRHRFSGNLVVAEKGKEATAADIIPISGRAMPMMNVAMLARAVNAGETLGESDIEWAHLPLDKAGADVVSDARQLAGSETRRAMSAQSVLRTRDLAKARMVAKGGLVVMQVESPGMLLTAQGRALTDGAMGETIRVTNTQSNRTIDAVIVGRDRVSVVPVTATTIAAR